MVPGMGGGVVPLRNPAISGLTRRNALKALAAAPLLAQNPAAGLPGQSAAPPNVPGVVTSGWVETPPHTRKVLIGWGDTRGAVLPHGSVSHAMSVIERIGYESGLWDTYIRSDDDMIVSGPPKIAGQLTLDDADAIFFMGHRSIALSDRQKADLISFVRDRGKGFVAAHGALTAFNNQWPEFTDMIGGYFAGHPWRGDLALGHIVNEAPDFPATKHFPAEFTHDDEYYMVTDFDRRKVRVLLRMDVSKLPAEHAYTRTDRDFPVAWVKNYGKGRVFYSSFGHSLEGWDNPNVERMYAEAIKWAMGMTEGDLTSRPLPVSQQGPPVAVPPQGPVPAAMQR
jgi:type 1 glutamine amidotransferase